jgi:outer membrane protein TolC
MKKFFLVILLISYLATPIFAREAAKLDFEAGQGTIVLSLEDCIFRALENNLDVAATRLTPQIKETEIIKTKSYFDPTLSLDLSADRTETHSTSPAGPLALVEENYDFNAGLKQELATGANYDLSFDNNRLRSNRSLLLQNPNPAYTSSFSYTLTQPLLKDFGVGISKADIFVARNNKAISLQMWRGTVSATITATEEAYWELVFACEDLKVKELSLRRAEELLETNKVRQEAGSASQLEVLAAEAEVAARQQEVILSQHTLSSAEDQLKVVTNLIQDTKLWNYDIIPKDKPSLEVNKTDLVESLRTAFQKRPDYEQAKIELKNRDIKIKLAKNELLPTLDLTGSIGLNGLDRHYNDAWREMHRGEYEFWSGGLLLEYPLGNRWARNNYKKRLLEKEQALIDFKKLEETIILQVREAVRKTNTDYKRVMVAETVRRLRERKLSAEEKRFQEGLATTQDILEYQEDLAGAQSTYLRSLIDYNKSLINLEARKGTVLEKGNIHLEE